jgi:glutathione S-transferase
MVISSLNSALANEEIIGASLMIKIFGDFKSGNCYKVQLLVSLLALKTEWIDIDILKGDTKTEGFLDLNPNGKIPLLQLDDGRVLSESNAILLYLADQSHLLPSDSFQRAKVFQWLFFEQYSHEPYIAVARFINKYLGLPDSRLADYESKKEGGYKALDIMEQQLSKTQFLVGDIMTVADIALYAYTHVAEDGGFELNRYREINRWINDIERLPNYVAMP